jgi:hypothetical protein
MLTRFETRLKTNVNEHLGIIYCRTTQLQLQPYGRKEKNLTVRQHWHRTENHESGSGSAWIRIDSALMDPDPQWQNGSV